VSLLPPRPLALLAPLLTAALVVPATAVAHDDDPKILDRVAPVHSPGFRPGALLSGGSLAGHQQVGLESRGDQRVLLSELDDVHVQFNSSDVQLLSWLPLNLLDPGALAGNDCWGYTSPSGNEYAIIGISTGTCFVDISSPSDPVLLEFVDGENSIWRDIKTFEEYAYIVSEGGGGIQVVDLSQIDSGVVNHVNTIFTGGNTSSHNVAIDTESGYLYRCGGGNGTGLKAYNLNNNPASPQYAGSWHNRYVHDAQVVTYTSGPYAGRQIAFACSGYSNGSGDTGLTIIDVTSKSNMWVRSQHYYPDAKYSHQAWLSPDRSTLFLNDELDENGAVPTQTFVIDVQDLSSPVNLGSFTNGNGAIGHNLYAKDNFVFEANYRSGLRVFDVTNPANGTEVAFFDTWPGDDQHQFNGLWSCYPFFPSGLVIGSDMERGLFVWKMGEPKLTFDLVAPDVIDPAGDQLSLQINELSLGDLESGSATLYYDAGEGIVEAPLQSQGGGSYLASFPALPCGSRVNWFVGARSTDGVFWSFPREAPYNNLTSIAVDDLVVIHEDDMETDQGWTTGEPTDNATSGFWELGVPVPNGAGTTEDHTPDGTLCWVTGQSGDVDGGRVTLTSPPYDLSAHGDPILSFWLWFRRSGETQGVDACRIMISGDGGANFVEMELIQQTPSHIDGSWAHKVYRVRDFVAPSSDVRLRVIARDGNLDTMVEAHVDDLLITQDDCGCSTANYCSSSTNSNGTAAQISFTGTAEISQDNFALTVTGGVPGNLGLFFYGPEQGSLPLGDGTLCIASSTVGIQRLQPPVQMDGSGAVSRSLDFGAPPASSGPGAVTPGSTWNFQFWYRDPAGGPGGSNLSDGLEVTFCH